MVQDKDREASPSVARILEEVAQARSLRTAPDSPCISTALLTGYRARSLSPEQEAGVVQHLADCAACRDRLVCIGEEVPGLSPASRRRVLQAFGPRRPMRWWPAMVGAVTAAALLFVLRPGVPVGGRLPDYAMAIDGYVENTRGKRAEPSSVRIFRPWSDIVLKVRPRQGVPSERPSVASYLGLPDGTFERFPVTPEVHMGPGGLIVLRVRAGTLLGDDYGVHRLRLVLFPAGETPPDRLDRTWSSPSARVFDEQITYRPAEDKAAGGDSR